DGDHEELSPDVWAARVVAIAAVVATLTDAGAAFGPEVSRGIGTRRHGSRRGSSSCQGNWKSKRDFAASSTSNSQPPSMRIRLSVSDCTTSAIITSHGQSALVA